MVLVSITLKNGRSFLNDRLIPKTDQANLAARFRLIINLK